MVENSDNFKGQVYNEALRTRYEHLDSFSVNDDFVKTSNTVLGIGGNTGSASTAEHLHLDVSTKYKSPLLDYMSKISGYESYYKKSSSDLDFRYYYSPELFNKNYMWKVKDANVYVELNQISN